MEILTLNQFWVPTCNRHRLYRPDAIDFRAHVVAYEKWLLANPSDTGFYSEQRKFYTESAAPGYVSERLIRDLASSGIEAAQRQLNPHQRKHQYQRFNR
ncbi:MAG: hypothetical protein V7739_17800 [Motiliproteus sp.]